MFRPTILACACALALASTSHAIDIDFRDPANGDYRIDAVRNVTGPDGNLYDAHRMELTVEELLDMQNSTPDRLVYGGYVWAALSSELYRLHIPMDGVITLDDGLAYYGSIPEPFVGFIENDDESYWEWTWEMASAPYYSPCTWVGCIDVGEDILYFGSDKFGLYERRFYNHPPPFHEPTLPAPPFEIRYTWIVTTPSVPEPSSATLLLCSLAVLSARGFRRGK